MGENLLAFCVSFIHGFIHLTKVSTSIRLHNTLESVEGCSLSVSSGLRSHFDLLRVLSMMVISASLNWPFSDGGSSVSAMCMIKLKHSC